MVFHPSKAWGVVISLPDPQPLQAIPLSWANSSSSSSTSLAKPRLTRMNPGVGGYYHCSMLGVRSWGPVRQTHIYGTETNRLIMVYPSSQPHSHWSQGLSGALLPGQFHRPNFALCGREDLAASMFESDWETKMWAPYVSLYFHINVHVVVPIPVIPLPNLFDHVSYSGKSWKTIKMATLWGIQLSTPQHQCRMKWLG